MNKTIDDLLMEKASFTDCLNTYLREECSHPAPQAELYDDLRVFLDTLIFAIRARRKK